MGKKIASVNEILGDVSRTFGGADAAGRGGQTYDLRTTVHAVTAIECALFDLLGQFRGVPVASLLGAVSRETASMCWAIFFSSPTGRNRACLIAKNPALLIRGCA